MRNHLIVFVVLGATASASMLVPASAYAADVATAPVDVPASLRSASIVLGLVGEPVRAPCAAIAIAPVDAWFGSGQAGIVAHAERNGEAVDPVEFAADAQAAEEWGEEWPSFIRRSIENCPSGFAFCVTQASTALGPRSVYCFVCCNDGYPYAACDGSHAIAICKCVGD